jgi:parvulin-like peptidyl-prolyl isomerase
LRLALGLVLVVALAAAVIGVTMAPLSDGRHAPSATTSEPIAISATTSAPAPAMLGARHALVQYQGSRRAPPGLTRTKDEAQRRASEIAQQAKELMREHAELDARAAAFGKLVGEYSDEPGAAERGGDLGRFRRGGMVAEFVTAVDALAVGEAGGPVETPFGYHVILRTY